MSIIPESATACWEDVVIDVWSDSVLTGASTCTCNCSVSVIECPIIIVQISS